MKIVFADPKVHTTVSKQYRYYDGLFDQLSKIHECTLCGKDVVSVLKQHNPDVLVLGLGWNEFKTDVFKTLNIPKVGFVFKPQNKLQDKLDFFKRNSFDLLVTSLPHCREYQESSGVDCQRLCFAADPEIFRPHKTKCFDVGFSGALHDNKIYRQGAFEFQNLRRQIQDYLLTRDDLTCFLNGSDSVAPRINNYAEYAKRISQSRFWLATPAAFGDMTPRYFEIPMSGTCLLCSAIPKAYRDIFRSGVNCIEFGNSLEEFKNVLNECLNNDVSEIVEKAKQEFRQKHTWQARAEEFSTMLHNIRG